MLYHFVYSYPLTNTLVFNYCRNLTPWDAIPRHSVRLRLGSTNPPVVGAQVIALPQALFACSAVSVVTPSCWESDLLSTSMLLSKNICAGTKKKAHLYFLSKVESWASWLMVL